MRGVLKLSGVDVQIKLLFKTKFIIMFKLISSDPFHHITFKLFNFIHAKNITKERTVLMDGNQTMAEVFYVNFEKWCFCHTMMASREL